MERKEINEKQREWRKIRLEKKANNIAIGNPGRPSNTPDVLWEKVDVKQPHECWLWKGYKNAEGYGRTWINGNGYYAHRVIFNLVHPNLIQLSAPKSTHDSGFLLHTCDNPSCCNPLHLFIGTHADNMADKVAKGRSPDFKSGRGPRCKLTMDQANEIREKRKNGISARQLAIDYQISLPSIKTLLAGKSYVLKE
jgi:hypothetical protein